MSYNGIGLKTARGSGTSGHIQNNLASISDDVKYEEFMKSKKRSAEVTDKDDLKDEFVNENKKILLDHNAKRQMELKCMELRFKLEEAGLDDDEIEEKVNDLRKELRNGGSNDKENETEQIPKTPDTAKDETENIPKTKTSGVETDEKRPVFKYVPLSEKKASRNEPKSSK